MQNQFNQFNQRCSFLNSQSKNESVIKGYKIISYRLMNGLSTQQDQIVLKTKTWRALNQELVGFKFVIMLLQGSKNDKHQKLTFSIQIISPSQKFRYFRKFKASELPPKAIAIFANVQTLYDYIQQHYEDSSRIKFFPDDNLFTVVNIVVMKNKQIKQQIVFYLTKQKYVIQKLASSISINKCKGCSDNLRNSSNQSKQLFQQSKLLLQSLIKDKNTQIQSKIAIMGQHMQKFIQEIIFLKNQNNANSAALDSCNMRVSKLQIQNTIMNQKIYILQGQKAKIRDMNRFQSNNNFTSYSSKYKNEIIQLQKQISEDKYHIDPINYSFQNIKQQQQKLQKIKVKYQGHSKVKPKADSTLPLFNELGNQAYALNEENVRRFGQKIHFSIDFEKNPYLSNFLFFQNIIQKISGDEQRHQILGKQNINILTLKGKSYFQIKIINTMSAGILIGMVGDVRKGQRYSYDKKQCVCYDGKGFIFQQGRKIRVSCKLDNGQTIRVVLDPLQCIIHWYVGYTQIGSTLIPEQMKKMKVVPYFELYDRNDKVAFNG